MDYIRSEFKKSKQKTDEGINTLQTLLEARIRKANSKTKAVKGELKHELEGLTTKLESQYWPFERTTRYTDSLVHRETEDLHNRLTAITSSLQD